MKRKIDWLNHSLEFFVVIIGILLAFQLNQCSENRTKKDLITNHLSQIKAECQENEKQLSLSIQQMDEQIEVCDALLEEITNKKNPEKIRNQATRLLDLRNLELSKNAYNVLVQSGDIRYLKNYQIKREIISMYESFKKIDQINQSNQNLYDNHFYPYLKSNFDLVNWSKVSTLSEEDEQMYYTREFANTVSTYRFLLIAKKRIYQNQKANIEAYLGK